MRISLAGLSVIDFFSFLKIARNYPVKELFRTQWKREPSTRSQCLLPGHSTLQILHQDARHALAYPSDPNARSVRHGPVHRDLFLFHHPEFAIETGFRCTPFLFRSGGLAN